MIIGIDLGTTNSACAAATKSVTSGLPSSTRVATTTLLGGKPSSATVARSGRTVLRRSPTGTTATACPLATSSILSSKLSTTAPVESGKIVRGAPWEHKIVSPAAKSSSDTDARSASR